MPGAARGGAGSFSSSHSRSMPTAPSPSTKPPRPCEKGRTASSGAEHAEAACRRTKDCTTSRVSDCSSESHATTTTRSTWPHLSALLAMVSAAVVLAHALVVEVLSPLALTIWASWTLAESRSCSATLRTLTSSDSRSASSTGAASATCASAARTRASSSARAALRTDASVDSCCSKEEAKMMPVPSRSSGASSHPPSAAISPASCSRSSPTATASARGLRELLVDLGRDAFVAHGGGVEAAAEADGGVVDGADLADAVHDGRDGGLADGDRVGAVGEERGHVPHDDGHGGGREQRWGGEAGRALLRVAPTPEPKRLGRLGRPDFFW